MINISNDFLFLWFMTKLTTNTESLENIWLYTYIQYFDVKMNLFFLHCLLASLVQRGPHPDDVAVIMYTSGSTGLAKGESSPFCSFNLDAMLLTGL